MLKQVLWTTAFALLVLFSCSKESAEQRTDAGPGTDTGAAGPPALPVHKRGVEEVGGRTSRNDVRETARALQGEEEPRPAAPVAQRDEFLDALPHLRDLVRRESIQPWVKLPDNLPFYRIEVSFDTDFMTYTGKLDLWAENRSNQAWDRLVFHLYPNHEEIAGDLKYLKILRAEVAGKEVRGDDRKTHFDLPLASPLVPGDSIHARLEFAGVVKRCSLGADDPASVLWDSVVSLLSDGSGDYGVFAYSSGVLTLALWYPILAAFDENGWDVGEAEKLGDFSYFDVSDYLVTVNMPESFSLATTGVALPARQRPDSTAKEGSSIKFTASGPDSPALEGDSAETMQPRSFAAAGVREFTLVAGQKLEVETTNVGQQGPVVVSSWARPEDGKTRHTVLDHAVESLRSFEGMFGRYPYKELDVVEADLFGGAGGVEFPGLVVIASMLYPDHLAALLPESKSVFKSRFFREVLEFVVAHEVAHQWWNAVVGSHSRIHPFMDEALANYSAILHFDRIRGQEAAQRQVKFELELPYQLHRLLGGKDLPVDLPTSQFAGILDYSAIVYSKGALFLRKMDETLSREKFLAALSSYYKRFSFSVASPGDLLQEFAAVGDPQVVFPLAERWLAQSHGDEDIPILDMPATVTALLEELDVDIDGFVKDVLSEEGFWELVKLGANLFNPEKVDIMEGVRWDKIADWTTRLAGKLMLELLM